MIRAHARFLYPITWAPAFDAAVLAVVSAAFDADTELAVLVSAAVVEALLCVVVAATVAVDVDAEAEADVCALVDSSAALTTAGKGAAGIAFPGGPTEMPRSRISPFSISYTQPWMKTSVSASPSARRSAALDAFAAAAASAAKCCESVSAHTQIKARF